MQPAQPHALAGRDVAICGSQAAVSAGVCDTGEDMAKAPRLNSSLNPPSQCAVAYGALRLGCDGNVAIGCAFNLEIKARFFEKKGNCFI